MAYPNSNGVQIYPSGVHRTRQEMHEIFRDNVLTTMQINSLNIQLNEISESNKKLLHEVNQLRHFIRTDETDVEKSHFYTYWPHYVLIVELKNLIRQISLKNYSHMTVHNKFWNIFKDALLMCSGHGWPNIVRKDKLFFRIFWVFFVMAAVAACSYFIISNTKEYYGYDIVTNIIIHHVNKLVFPALTVCENNGELPGMLNMLLNSSCTFSEDPIHYEINYQKVTLTDNYFQNYDCIRFNGIELETQSKPLESTKAGYLGGLYLEMFLNTYGVFFFLGDNYVAPTYLELNSAFTGGSEVYMSISRLEQNNLGEPYSSCVTRTNIGRGPHYRQINCFEACLKKILSAECGCIVAGSGESGCTRENSCYENGKRFFNYTKECSSDCPLECESITYATHTERVNYIFKEYDYEAVLHNAAEKEFTPNMTDFEKRFLRVYIFYDQMQYTEITQIPKLTPTSLLSNIGGTMGLFMGLSLLSFIEIIELVSLFFWAFIKKCQFGVKKIY